MANLFQGSMHAWAYSKFRPSPPPALINAIISFMKSKTSLSFGCAVDIGCGAGHSTVALSPYFEKVIGLDVSKAQIENAKTERAAPNVTYRVSSAEETHIGSSSVDLVSVGQALHWFDPDRFFDEVKRVLVPQGVVAAYGYWIPTPTTGNKEQSLELKHLITNYLHDDLLGKYWDSRRIDILKKSYETIPFPFDNCLRETFIKRTSSTVSDYIGYLSSWSAIQVLKKENPVEGETILPEIQEKLMKILNVKTSAEETSLSIVIDYFLVMGINPT